jgi:hypothetical protein
MQILPGMTIPRKNPNPPDERYVAQYSNEADFQRDVARWFKQMGGWRVYHTYQSTHSTHGFPDLAFVHSTARISGHSELKTEKGKVTDDQADWLADYADAGELVYLWRPSDIDEIMAFLQHVNDIAFRAA